MDAILNRAIRDQAGNWQRPGEKVVIRSQLRRADFDTRLRVQVTFADGARGGVFTEELEEVS